MQTKYFFLFIFMTAKAIAMVDSTYSSIAYPYETAFINTATPAIAGLLYTSELQPISEEPITIFIDSIEIATVISNNMGVWYYQLTEIQALEEGDHVISARANTSGIDLPSKNFTINTIAPSPPTITFPLDGATLTSSSVTVTGTTEPENVINIFLNTEEVFTGPIFPDTNGIWSYTLDLADGSYTLTARAQDYAFNVSNDSLAVTFTISTA